MVRVCIELICWAVQVASKTGSVGPHITVYQKLDRPTVSEEDRGKWRFQTLRHGEQRCKDMYVLLWQCMGHLEGLVGPCITAFL